MAHTSMSTTVMAERRDHTQPVLTNDEHYCGATLYHVGSDSVLFCPQCSEHVSENTQMALSDTDT